MGGDGWRSTKKIFAQGKIKYKNSCTAINPKKYSCYGLKQLHTRNLMTKKRFLLLENSPPPPPHNFSNGPSLSSIIMLLKLDNLTRNVRLSEVLRTWIEFFYSCFLVGTSLSKTRYKWVSFFSRTL